MTETEAQVSYEKLNSLKDNNFTGTKILATTIQDISNIIQYVAELKRITAITELKFNSKDKAITEKVNSLYNNISKLELNDLEIKNRPKKNEKILESTIKELINIALNAYENRDDGILQLYPIEESPSYKWRKFYYQIGGLESNNDRGPLNNGEIDNQIGDNETEVDVKIPGANLDSRDISEEKKIIIRGTHKSEGNINTGERTGAQVQLIENTLAEYSKLIFKATIQIAEELQTPNVYLKFGTEESLINNSPDGKNPTYLAHRLDMVPINSNGYYEIKLSDFKSLLEAEQKENPAVITDLSEYSYIAFFVINSDNGGHKTPKITIEELWLEPKEG